MIWLRWLGHLEGKHIQHAQNGKEMKIGKYKVDGYSEEDHSVYEFNGCFYHGCPKCFNPDTINPKTNVPMYELYTRTQEKKTFIKNQTGFSYVEMWECEWDEMYQIRRD